MLIVNDSVLEKAHTDAKELICTHWNHSQQRYVKGLNFVSLRYQAGELVRKTVPVYLPKRRKPAPGARSPRHGLQMIFEVVGGGEVASGRVSAFGIVIGDVTTGFKLGFCQVRKVATVK